MDAAEPDAEQDDCDREPSLGGLDHNWSQEVWAEGGSRDLEQDPSENSIAYWEGVLDKLAAGIGRKRW